MSLNITFIIFTYNEEKRIEYAVRNFVNFGRVLIMDGGSTDKTGEIAEKYGATVLKRPKSSKVFVENQEIFNFVFQNTKTDWIYWGYVDNLAPKKLLDKLVEISKQNKIKYVQIPLYTYLWGELKNPVIKGYSPMFFRKECMDFSKNKIHGMGQFLGKKDEILSLPNSGEFALMHFSLYNLEKFLPGHMRYAVAEAGQKFSEGKKFKVSIMLGAMLRYFWLYYRNGYKNGIVGLIIALNYAFFRFMVYVKLYELEKGIDLESIENKYIESKNELLREFNK